MRANARTRPRALGTGDHDDDDHSVRGLIPSYDTMLNTVRPTVMAMPQNSNHQKRRDGRQMRHPPGDPKR